MFENDQKVSETNNPKKKQQSRGRGNKATTEVANRSGLDEENVNDYYEGGLDNNRKNMEYRESLGFDRKIKGDPSGYEQRDLNFKANLASYEQYGIPKIHVTFDLNEGRPIQMIKINSDGSYEFCQEAVEVITVSLKIISYESI